MTDTPITSTTTTGPLNLNLTVPATGNYGDSATLIAELNGQSVGSNLFTPQNNQWTVTDFQVGTTTVSFKANYAPPTSGTLGNITITDGVVTVEGQNPQPFSGTSFSWTSDGTVVIPPAS